LFSSNLNQVFTCLNSSKINSHSFSTYWNRFDYSS
jgi:hypothetical protein